MADKNVDLYYCMDLSPEDVIKYFEQKGFTFSWDWHEVWQEAQAKAFTVAKVMKLDILQSIYDEVDKAVKEGITAEQFAKDLEPELRSLGWWGKVRAEDVPGYDPDSDIDPNKEIQLGSPYRLNIIYRTNLQTSYMAGRYKQQMANKDARPCFMWVSILDENTRPMHAALDGRVFKYDDVFWDTHYPPIDWGCRCRVRALTDDQVKAMGLHIEQDSAIWIEKVHVGAGWGFNPGKFIFMPDLNNYSPEIADLF
jgi:SPP1 gp7 family putative phage head morphogenesis protein